MLDVGCSLLSQRLVWLCCLLAAVLAGCATDPRSSRERAPDWEQEGGASAPSMPLTPPPPASVPVAPPPSAPVNPPAETWVPLRHWCQVNGLAAPCPVTVGSLAAWAVNTPSGAWVLRAGSRLAQWDGLEVRLGFAPQSIDGELYVHSLDLKKTLEPLIQRSFLSGLGTNPTVVIDAGHGGADSGARSVLGYHYEKEFTLDWARRLAPLLAADGWRVFLTRNSDTELSLSNRIAFAEACRADLFLSLHFNSSAPDERQEGLETYCLTPTGMTSSITRGYDDDPALAFPNNAFDAQNLQLAFQVHQALFRSMVGRIGACAAPGISACCAAKTARRS